MKKYYIIPVLLVVAIIVFAQIKPSGFMGTIDYENGSIVHNKVLTAEYGGNTETTNAYDGIYLIYLYGGTDGDVVTFSVEGNPATPTGIYETGFTNTSFNLVVSSGGAPPSGCTPGAACTECTGWVNYPGLGIDVRDADGLGGYDWACCGGTIKVITAYSY